jgi:hypothetical protein
MKCWPNAGKVERKLFEVISHIFKNHPYLLDFLFEPDVAKIRALPEEIISESGDLSCGEDLLVRIAIDLWSGGFGDACVWELVEILDEQNFNNVLEALSKLRPKHREGFQGPVCRQLKLDSLSIGEDVDF